jgi:aspartate/methionine/tyrosine aminotransferase
MTLLAGGTPRVVECGIEDRFKLSPVALERALSPATRWLWLNSPCNPTGASYSRREFAALGEVLQKYPRVLIMSDEIYEHIHYTDEPPISFASACPVACSSHGDCQWSVQDLCDDGLADRICRGPPPILHRSWERYSRSQPRT